MDSSFFAYKTHLIVGGDDMNVIIFNSLVVFVLFATFLMGVFLIYLACKLDKEEKAREEAIMKENEKILKRDDDFSIFDITDLKK